MKKLFILLSSCLMLASCNAGSSPYSKYFNKTYGGSRGCEFHETFLKFKEQDRRYACFYDEEYVGRFSSGNYSTDADKQYVCVYAQGVISTNSHAYLFFGFFYDEKAFITTASSAGSYAVYTCE